METEGEITTETLTVALGLNLIKQVGLEKTQINI